MRIEELKQVARENGVVGAGGAGFPAYAKMNEKADTVILNCVECEPLLKLHRQLLAVHTDSILQMLEELRKTLGAKEAIIGIKSEYVTTIRQIKEVLGHYSNIKICEVRPAYPMGDEVVLIYEATGRVIRPGGLPIDENVVVYNVETVYNLYRAVYGGMPVTDKFVSIVGEVEHPLTLRIPLGATVRDAVALAGGVTTKEPMYIIGGPMMGCIGTENTRITKTTNAIIVLPQEHSLCTGMVKNVAFERRKAASSCCQCKTCTDLCPRHALGHPIEPHKVMRAVANTDTSDLQVYVNTRYCSGCGVCEKYACPQGLSPKSMIQAFKSQLRGVPIPKEQVLQYSVAEERELRQIPIHRLVGRLGLQKYNVAAPFVDTLQTVSSVTIPLSQHIGLPAIPLVARGDTVTLGQKIGEAKDGLSVAIHCSLDGVVEQVTDKEIIVRRK